MDHPFPTDLPKQNLHQHTPASHGLSSTALKHEGSNSENSYFDKKYIFTPKIKFNYRRMKPAEIAKIFSEYIEEGSTPKGLKIQSFFSHLPPSQMRVVANNISKAYSSHLQAEKEKSEMRKKRKQEISELKKKAKELGLTVT